jgi:hypothetical protein
MHLSEAFTKDFLDEIELRNWMRVSRMVREMRGCGFGEVFVPRAICSALHAPFGTTWKELSQYVRHGEC